LKWNWEIFRLNKSPYVCSVGEVASDSSSSSPLASYPNKLLWPTDTAIWGIQDQSLTNEGEAVYFSSEMYNNESLWWYKIESASSSVNTVEILVNSQNGAFLEIYSSQGIGNYTYESTIFGEDLYTLRIGYFGTAYVLANSYSDETQISFTVIGSQVYSKPSSAIIWIILFSVLIAIIIIIAVTVWALNYIMRNNLKIKGKNYEINKNEMNTIIKTLRQGETNSLSDQDPNSLNTPDESFARSGTRNSKPKKAK